MAVLSQLHTADLERQRASQVLADYLLFSDPEALAEGHVIFEDSKSLPQSRATRSRSRAHSKPPLLRCFSLLALVFVRVACFEIVLSVQLLTLMPRWPCGCVAEHSTGKIVFGLGDLETGVQYQTKGGLSLVRKTAKTALLDGSFL